MPPQKQQPITLDPNNLFNPFLSQPILSGPQVQLPREPDNRKLGVDPMGDLIDAILGGIGIRDPYDPHSSQAAVLGSGLSAAVPLLPGLGSRLSSMVEALPAKNVHPNKLLQMAQQVPEEAQFTGFTDWLKSKLGMAPNANIPTQEARDFLSQNALPLTEHVKGGPIDISKFDPSQVAINFGPAYHPTDQRNGIQVLNNDDYNGYVLPARLNDPEGEFIANVPHQAKHGTFPTEQEAKDFVAQHWIDRQRNMFLSDPEHVADYSQYTLPGGKDYTTRAIQLNNGSNFESHPSFDPGNMLAWSRANVHDSPSGPMKFIEEIQSDWHQGNAEGYQDSAALAKAQQAYYDRYNEADKASRDFVDARGAIANSNDIMNLSPDDLLNKYPELTDLRAATINKYAISDQARAAYYAAQNGVTDAPFKQAWPDLMLKRELYDAAQQGHSGIAWTPGSVQNQRWNLGSVAQQALFQPTEGAVDKSGVLSIVDPQGVSKDYMVGGDQPLDAYVGQSVAEHLHNNPNIWHDTANMEIGGQGMRQFYDQALPAKMQKIIGPFGGKVEPVGRLNDNTLSFDPAQQEGTSILGARLTPEMRDAILKKGFYALSPLLAATLGGASFLNNGQNGGSQ